MTTGARMDRGPCSGRICPNAGISASLAGRAAEAAPAGRSPPPRIESDLVSAARHVGHEVAGEHPGECRSRQSLGVAQRAFENVRKGALQRLRLHLKGIWVFHADSLA